MNIVTKVLSLMSVLGWSSANQEFKYKIRQEQADLRDLQGARTECFL